MLWTLSVINILRVQAGQATVSKLQLHETSVAECIHSLLPATQLSLLLTPSQWGKREKLPGSVKLEGGLIKVFNS